MRFNKIFEIFLFFLNTWPASIIPVVMISCDGENSQRCTKFIEDIHVGLHLITLGINKITSEENNVRFFFLEQFDSAFHGCFIPKATGVNIRNLTDLDTIECFRKIWEFYRYSFKVIIMRS